LAVKKLGVVLDTALQNLNVARINLVSFYDAKFRIFFELAKRFSSAQILLIIIAYNPKGFLLLILALQKKVSCFHRVVVQFVVFMLCVFWGNRYLKT